MCCISNAQLMTKSKRDLTQTENTGIKLLVVISWCGGADFIQYFWSCVDVVCVKRECSGFYGILHTYCWCCLNFIYVFLLLQNKLHNTFQPKICNMEFIFNYFVRHLEHVLFNLQCINVFLSTEAKIREKHWLNCYVRPQDTLSKSFHLCQI